MEGTKYDQGKLRWDLVPWHEMKAVAGVLTHGSKKYDDDNWKKVDIWHYKRALMEHYSAYMEFCQDGIGSPIDECGYHHLANVICNALFLMWHEANRPMPNWHEANRQAHWTQKQVEELVAEGKKPTLTNPLKATH